MTIKGIDAKRAEETHMRLVEMQEKVRQGGQAVLDAIDRQNRESILPGWKAIAEKQEQATIEAFVDVLWNQMCKPDGLEFEFSLNSSGEKTQMHCTYCPWAEIAKAAEATEVGYWMFCKSDPHMVDGFNQAAGPDERKIKFSRSKTIMQGDAYCDHTYEYEEEAR
jgi:hypothetical protein